MQISSEEIVPGLVVRLDTTILRELGGSQTNAVIGAEGDRAVTGTHDFLVVGIDHRTRACTAVPLFHKTAVGNQPLEESRKTGPGADWTGADVYFSRWQHWRLPEASVVAASEPDPASPGARRHYATGDGPTLDDIKAWESRNRANYREL